jgi:septum formation topological specificity factor MinE
LKKVTKEDKKKRPTLFVKNKRGQTTKLKINRKNVLSVLVDKQIQIERFVLKNNLSKNDSITWAIMLVLFPSKKHKK